jgi:hypothetical protein
MSHAELDSWIEFYNLHPFDDRHRFHRPAALLAHTIGGRDVRAMMSWLGSELQPAAPGEQPTTTRSPGQADPEKVAQAIEEVENPAPAEVNEDGWTVADLNTMASLGVKIPRRKVKEA